MKRLALFYVLLVSIGCQLAMGQTVEITGTIKSLEDGQPLPGASVMVKGTNVGTTTDIDGKYSLAVPTDAKTLVINFVGLKTQEVEIGGRTVVDVTMEPEAKALGEVVVTALNMKRSEKALGYSVATVQGDEITKTGQSTVMNSLQGKLAGVVISTSGGLPGASTKVILRGYASILGNNNPLYIVDGSPINNSDRLQNGVDYGNGANDINPDDVESVNILRGAAATALYGSRAASGVVMITTKKGQASGKVKVTISSNMTFSDPLRIPQLQNQFGTGWNAIDDLTQNGSWGPAFDGKVRPWGAVVNNSQQIKPYVALPSNVADFFKTGKSYNNSITLSGGTEFTNYFLSYANASINGMLPANVDFDHRNTFSARGTVKGKRITFTASANYVNRKGQNPPDGLGNSVASNLYGDILQTPRDVSLVDLKDYQNNVFANSDNYFTPFAYNPYYSLNEVGSKFLENRFFGNISLEYNILKDLKATWRVGTDVSSFTRDDWEAILTFTPGSFSALGGKKPDPGYASNYYSINTEINNDVVLSYQKKITDNWNFSILAGYNTNERTRKSQLTDVSTLDIPYYYNIRNSSSTPSINRTDGFFVNLTPYNFTRRLQGAYGEIDLSLKEFWFISATGRRDWSSTLPLDHNHFDYYGLNTSLVLTDAIPTLRNDYFSFGKFRVSYGTTGNDAAVYEIKSVFVPTSIYGPYGNTNFPINGINGFSQGNQIGNASLKPEISKELELGTDLRFVDSRLRFDITYYHKVSSDEILPVPISPSSGFASQIMNFGKVQNQGWEITISATPVKTKDIDWTVAWNWSRNHSRVLELAPGLDQVLIQNSGYNVDFVAIKDQPLGVFKGPVPIYDPQGRIVVDANGFPLKDPAKGIYGNAQANYIAGITNNLNIKGFSLGFVIDIRQGGLIYSDIADLTYFSGNAKQTTYNNRQPFIVPNSVHGVQDATTGKWTYSENTTPIKMFDITDYYYFTKNPIAERNFVLPRSYTKLREVTLSYSIPKKFISQMFITNAEIGVYGKNLIIWTPSGNNFIDPEISSYGNDLTGDFGEFRTNPTARQYGINLKLSF